jgi:hypothetical protein
MLQGTPQAPSGDVPQTPTPGALLMKHGICPSNNNPQ